MERIPEEATLAVRLGLGLATPAEVIAFVDCRIDAAPRVDGALLDLCDIARLPRDEIALRLLALAGARGEKAAMLAVAAGCAEWEAGNVGIESTVDYFATWHGRLPQDLSDDVGHVLDWIGDERAIYGEVRWDQLAPTLARLGADCRARLR